MLTVGHWISPAQTFDLTDLERLIKISLYLFPKENISFLFQSIEIVNELQHSIDWKDLATCPWSRLSINEFENIEKSIYSYFCKVFQLSWSNIMIESKRANELRIYVYTQYVYPSNGKCHHFVWNRWTSESDEKRNRTTGITFSSAVVE